MLHQVKLAKVISTSKIENSGIKGKHLWKARQNYNPVHPSRIVKNLIDIY